MYGPLALTKSIPTVRIEPVVFTLCVIHGIERMVTIPVAKYDNPWNGKLAISMASTWCILLPFSIHSECSPKFGSDWADMLC